MGGGDSYSLNDSNQSDGGSASAHQVYIRSTEHAWIPARVVNIDASANEATVAVDHYDGEQEMFWSSPTKTARESVFVVSLLDYVGRVLPLQSTDDRGQLKDFEDMVDLPYLHEASILYNLKYRHIQGKPYTRTSDIVIAINPYRWYENLYTVEQQQFYAQKLLWEEHGRDARDMRAAVSPHVYETSALSYKGMALQGIDQSILVSGESGAGKTETVKLCISHIASVQRGPNMDAIDDPMGELIIQRVLDTNPLLESFGNAKTRRNDNSSRFGKYTQLQFDRKYLDGAIPEGMFAASRSRQSPAILAGSTCEVYLLEKNRVVSHDTDERTFHVFYELLSAPNDEKSKIWEGLEDTDNDTFAYVGRTSTRAIEGVSDTDRFFETKETLELIGVKGDTLLNLFRALCAVLQLGNIVFSPDPNDDDKSVIESEDELQLLEHLMGVPLDTLTLALTERTMKTKNETYKVPLKAGVAKESADAFAKEIYQRVFLWLVQTINLATAAEHNYENAHARQEGEQYGIIGLLDIFGFEAFYVNRFEQLCINYANEKLQYKFTEDCFRSVEEEYLEEGIALEHIMYDDNTDVLDLIEGRTGLLAMLNEECIRPQGNATAFVNKALNENKKSPCLIVNNMDRLSFGIHHYAGKVLYDAENFVTRNMDTLPSDLKECGVLCSNPTISKEFAEAFAEADKKNARSGNSNLIGTTVWSKYKTQLTKLMNSLKQTQSRYIRTIKPNGLKEPLLMEHSMAVAQLRSCGIVAGVTIARSAFPNRMANNTVLARFGGIWFKQNRGASTVVNTGESLTALEKLRVDVEALMNYALRSKAIDNESTGTTTPAYAVGKTKTYFRAGALEYLESERIIGLDSQALIIQREYRKWLKLRKTLKAARAIRERNEKRTREAREKREKIEAEERRKREEEEKRWREHMAKVDAETRARQEKLEAEIRELNERAADEMAAATAIAQAEATAWAEAMAKGKAEWKAKTAMESAERAAVKEAEMSPYRDEVDRLTKELEECDAQTKAEVSALNQRAREAKKVVADYETKCEDIEDEQRKIKRQIAFNDAILKEKVKLIDHLKKENKRLKKIEERTLKTFSTLDENNKKLMKVCAETGKKFDQANNDDDSIDMEHDELQERYGAAKQQNHELHAKVSKQQEHYLLMAQCRLELQHTLAAVLSLIDTHSKSKKLKEIAARTGVDVQNSAYNTMQALEAMTREDGTLLDQSVSDFNQSWDETDLHESWLPRV